MPLEGSEYGNRGSGGRKELNHLFLLTWRQCPLSRHTWKTKCLWVVSPHTIGGSTAMGWAGPAAPLFPQSLGSLMAGFCWGREHIASSCMESLYGRLGLLPGDSTLGWPPHSISGPCFQPLSLLGLCVLSEVNEIIVTSLPLNSFGCGPSSSCAWRKSAGALGIQSLDF